MIVLRPRLPRSVMGLGTPKHCVLMYCVGLTGLTSEPQPEAETKFGTSMFGSVLFTPRASPPKPGVNGTPVVASKTPPISHPLRAHSLTPCAHFGVPSSHV